MPTLTPFQNLYSKYVVWDENNIKGFFGQYWFLSNFYQPATVYIDGLIYPSSEHAYMACKTNNMEEKLKFTKFSSEDSFLLTPAEARKLGRHGITLRPDWEDIKYDVMLAVVFDKFSRNINLRDKLLATDNKYLEETNHWNDTYWGFSWQKQEGQNNLGKILMKVRECLRK